MYFGVVGQGRSIAVKYIGNKKAGGSIHGRGKFICFTLRSDIDEMSGL